ncbi:HD domain-containing protein [Patescibacteria group bacterium AH-259-L07]|nr:HD domain-containing protein [Patescibacteria group bacterium AH-259-L07]
MEKVYEEIFELSKPYQDTRDDAGHAEIVAQFAIELLKSESADEEIVVPAAILHDIGWSQLSEEERFYIFKNKITKEKELSMKSKVDVRVKHEIEGARLAKKILNDLNYDSEKTKKIVEIIRQHDTNKNPISKEDRVLKDADKLWTFTLTGIEADERRFGYSKEKLIDMAEKRIDRSDYFLTESAKKLARRELMKVKN